MLLPVVMWVSSLREPSRAYSVGWMDCGGWRSRETSRIDFDSFVETVDLRPAKLSFVHRARGTFVAAGQRLNPTGTKNATLSSSPSPDVGAVVLKLGQSRFAPSSVQGSTHRLLRSPMAGNSVTAELVGMLAQLYVWGYTPDFAAIDSPWSRQKLRCRITHSRGDATGSMDLLRLGRHRRGQ